MMRLPKRNSINTIIVHENEEYQVITYVGDSEYYVYSKDDSYWWDRIKAVFAYANTSKEMAIAYADFLVDYHKRLHEDEFNRSPLDYNHLKFKMNIDIELLEKKKLPSEKEKEMMALLGMNTEPISDDHKCV